MNYIHDKSIVTLLTATAVLNRETTRISLV